MSTAGNATWFTEEPEHRPLWSVAWANATMSVVGETPTVGQMANVTGQIFDPHDAKSFKADQARANRATKTLTLTGAVSVTSSKQGENLRCDKLIYNAERKLYEAEGHVSMTTRTVVIDNIPAAIANSDFDKVASPDMFKEANNGKP